MGLKQDIEFIKDRFEEEENKKNKKTKKFRYPFGKKVGSAQKKKNYITLFRINENGSGVIKKVRIDEQTFIEEGIPRLAAAGYVINIKKNPWIILPSWSVEPFSAMDNYKKSLKDGTNTVGFKLLMNKMKLEAVNPKKQLGSMFKWILGLGLVGILLYAFISGGGA